MFQDISEPLSANPYMDPDQMTWSLYNGTMFVRAFSAPPNVGQIRDEVGDAAIMRDLSIRYCRSAGLTEEATKLVRFIRNYVSDSRKIEQIRMLRQYHQAMHGEQLELRVAKETIEAYRGS